MYWFLIKSILSSVVGSQFYKWYAQTKIGIYFQNRINQFLSNFEQDYPLMMERIHKLEGWSHPDREEEFKKVIKKLEARLAKLEKKSK